MLSVTVIIRTKTANEDSQPHGASYPKSIAHFTNIPKYSCGSFGVNLDTHTSSHSPSAPPVTEEKGNQGLFLAAPRPGRMTVLNGEAFVLPVTSGGRDDGDDEEKED
ncbi:hypothetical protein E2C01_057508 [Portunus trituberculatus]|uniref:Uncharacterized protein n=1 Tax=Portunus trituberculatus TaxID=210409 RepID=A0A5B7GTP2_PORTR|nr:hypothetical protein [Portunus trituberculatus]